MGGRPVAERSEAAPGQAGDDRPIHIHQDDKPLLEALPLPAGVMPVEPPAKPFVRHNPTMSFDDILKDIPNGKKR